LEPHRPRQFVSDVSNLGGIIGFLIVAYALYWFYNTIRQMERTLKEVRKKVSAGKPS